MPRETLEPDRESLDAWDKLPQNAPSKEALPPATGGLKLAGVLLLGMAVLIILALVFRGLPA